MVEIDLSSVDLGRVANQDVNAFRIANQNIWVADSGPPITYRVWPSTDGPDQWQNDPATYSMAMQFRVTADCTVTAIYFWRAPRAFNGVDTNAGHPFVTRCGIFDSDSHLLVSPAETIAAPGTNVGWIKHILATPIPIDTLHIYKVAVFGAPTGYSATSFYWTSGDGAAGITNGILHADSAAEAVSGDQDSFTTAAGDIAFPTSSFNAGNYWIDLEVTV